MLYNRGEPRAMVITLGQVLPNLMSICYDCGRYVNYSRLLQLNQCDLAAFFDKKREEEYENGKNSGSGRNSGLFDGGVAADGANTRKTRDGCC